MTASITITTGRAPPGKRRQPEPIKQISFQECVREIERAIAELIRLDTLMTQTENQLNTYRTQIDDPAIDEWDVIEIERQLPGLNEQWGQACTQLAIEMNSVIYHGQRLIDDWLDLLISKIGRQHSQYAPFYQRAEQTWPAVAAHPVWMQVRSEGVPF